MIKRLALIGTMLALSVGPVANAQGGLPTERAVLTDAPQVPPPITRKTSARVLVDLDVIEVVNEIADGVKYTLWTYGGHVPGKFIRVREGDTVTFTLRNLTSNLVPHNIDLHSVTGPGGGAKVTLISPGQQATFDWKALKSGIYVYHCATAPVPMHLSNGMFGLILVEPAKGLPKVDREFYIMQSEFYTQKSELQPEAAPGYTGSGTPGVSKGALYEFSFDKMLAENPDYVPWNGRIGSLTGANALKTKVGESVRFYVGNAGLNLVSSFHIIGDHLEKVYSEGSLDSPPLLNVQNHVIPAGAAAVVDTIFEVPGDYPLVDHSLGRTFNKGTLGIINVDGPPRPDIFKLVSTGPLQDGNGKAEAPKIKVAAKVALAECAACHDIGPAKRKIVGPPLYGLLGKKPLSPGLPYAKWDRAALNEWLRDPVQIKANTMMTYRVRDDAARNQILDALESLAEGK
ncbi:MAG: nitrite reductase, copper-containing [Candidatus Sericytochromatia bacterium]|nr:nitrite reductase, copper-containing [Candidatus Tanganyikabacteria bacterium]